MNLTDEEENYKIPIIKEGSKHFFSIHCAKDWDFYTYFEETHNDINKYKQLSKVQGDYQADLRWIARLDQIPVKIKEHVEALAREPDKAQLKATIAKRANKKRKIDSTQLVINGDIKGGTINSNSYIECQVYSTNESEGIKTKRKQTVEHRELDTDKNEEENVSGGERKPSVWLDWLKYLNCHSDVFHPYSPEANGVIRSGKGISPRPHLDREIYEAHMNEKTVERYSIPEKYHKFIDLYIDSSDLKGAKKAIRYLFSHLGSIEDETEAEELEFLEKVLTEAHRSYSSDLDAKTSEDAFNQLIVYPCIKIATESIETNGGKACFIQGQSIVESMNKQLRASGFSIDEKSQYKSDGQVKIFNLKNLELMLLETSGCFSNNDKVKLNFDHHKGMFGALAMLKCIADNYNYASVEQFSKVKVFFLNAAGVHLYLWSLSYKQEGLFDFSLESSLLIRQEFEDRQDYIPELVQFCLVLKNQIKNCIENIAILKDQHVKTKASHRYLDKPGPNLNDLVNPIILKLTKEEDSLGMADLGPVYSPPHY